MIKHWITGAMALVLVAGSTGCVALDKYQALERANRTLEEAKAQLADDLQNAQLEIQQKNTTIDGLNKQLLDKDKLIASLTDEVKGLRDAQAQALSILEKQAGAGPGSTVILRPALPEPLHNALKAFAEANPDLVEYDAAKGAVRWKADLLFPLGSDQLTTAADVTGALQKFASIVNSEAAQGFDVIIVGHTCTTPIRKAETLAKHPTNWHLSAHRAISVMNIMAEQQVAATRMGVMGYGEYRPIADNSTEQGKAKNRRVEIYLVPKESVKAVSQNLYRVNDMGLSFARL